MSERIKWIEYNGKKILHTDFSGLSGEDYLKLLDEHEKEIMKSKMSRVLVLNDITNCVMDASATGRVKQLMKDTGEKNIKLVIALVGVSGMKRTIANLIERGMHFASSVDDAKEWLSKQ